MREIKLVLCIKISEVDGARLSAIGNDGMNCPTIVGQRGGNSPWAAWKEGLEWVYCSSDFLPAFPGRNDSWVDMVDDLS